MHSKTKAPKRIVSLILLFLVVTVFLIVMLTNHYTKNSNDVDVYYKTGNIINSEISQDEAEKNAIEYIIKNSSTDDFNYSNIQSYFRDDNVWQITFMFDDNVLDSDITVLEDKSGNILSVNGNLPNGSDKYISTVSLLEKQINRININDYKNIDYYVVNKTNLKKDKSNVVSGLSIRRYYYDSKLSVYLLWDYDTGAIWSFRIDEIECQSMFVKQNGLICYKL